MSLNYLVPNNEPSWLLLPLSLSGERHTPTSTWETTRVMLINCKGKDASHHVLWLSARLEVKVESTGCWVTLGYVQKDLSLELMLTTLTLSALSSEPPTLTCPWYNSFRVPIMIWGLQPMLPCSFFPPKVSLLISGGHYRLPIKLLGCPCPVCCLVWVRGTRKFSKSSTKSIGSFLSWSFHFSPKSDLGHLPSSQGLFACWSSQA